MASKKKSKAKPARRREVTVAKHHEVQQDRTETATRDESDRPAARPPAPAPEEVDRAVEHMSQVWSSAVPEAALHEPFYELPDNDSLRRLKNNKVPDGSYRVTGHEWILEFSGGQLVAVEHVTADTDHAAYTSIPQPRET